MGQAVIKFELKYLATEALKMAKIQILIIAMIFAAAASAVPAKKKTAVAGSISKPDDEEQRSEAGSCNTVPDGFCAALYDDEDCRGWSFQVPTGSYDLPEDLKDDAEVVVVRAGCKFTGFNNKESRGKSSFCDALNSPVDMYCDIWDGYLRDKYASVECLCR